MTMPETLKPDELVLKPCPFCGHTNIVKCVDDSGDYPQFFETWYECNVCDARSSQIVHRGRSNEAIDYDAVDAWNTRAPNLALQADLERVTSERDANGLEAHTLRGERDRAKTDAAKWLGLHDAQEARADTAEAALVKARTAMEWIATSWNIPEYSEKRDPGSPYDLLWKAIRAAREALKTGEDNGR